MRFHSSNLTIKDQVHISLQNKLTIHRVQNKPLYHGNQGGLPQTLHPAGASFRAHDYNRGVNQGLLVEQSKDLGDSNQSVEKVPLYSGNLGRSYRMMFPMGASFRNRDSNQGAIQQHPTFPVDINQDKQRPVNSTNQGQSS